jgi:hypothetical protein
MFIKKLSAYSIKVNHTNYNIPTLTTSLIISKSIYTVSKYYNKLLLRLNVWSYLKNKFNFYNVLNTL